MIYLLAYVSLLILPGLGAALRIGTPVYLAVPVSVLCSYFLFMLCAFSGRLFALDPKTVILSWLVVAGLFVLLGAYWAVRKRYPADRSTFMDPPGIIVFLACMIIFLIYLVWAGPYLEVPSDAWWHLGRMQDQIESIAAGRGDTPASLKDLFAKNNGYWYLLQASMVWISGHTIESAVPYVSVLNPLVFGISIYGFAYFIFKNMPLSDAARHVAAAMSVLFFVVYFGVSVFSYIRYYALAPTMLTYVIYLASLSVFLMFIDRGMGPLATLLVLIAASVVLLAVHKQELMFLLLASSAVVVYTFVRRTRRMFGTDPLTTAEIDVTQKTPEVPYAWIAAAFVLLLITYIVVHLYLFTQVDRHSALTHGRMIDLNLVLPFLKNLYILDPTKNFYSAVTVWGLFVYIVYFRMRRLFARNAYLPAVMILPVFTVFNPVFVDLFLRISWPEVMWRITYMLPLCFVAAYLFVCMVLRLRGGGGLTSMAGYSISLVLLVVLLFPFSGRFVEARESRFLTLDQVDPGNDHRQWSDLLEYLKSRAPGSVLTDRITGYVINGLTHHQYSGYKHLGRGALDMGKDQYSPVMFRGMGSYLLVVNMRDGKSSEAGRISGHWSENELKVSRYYSRALLDFIDANPGMFGLQWTADRIRVYEVKSGY